MSKEGRTTAEGEKTYAAKLDDEILYLLRLRAMQEEACNDYCTTNESKLYCHFMEDKDYLRSEDESYFKRLSEAIGYKDNNKGKKRVDEKRQYAWDLIRRKIDNFDSRFAQVQVVKDINDNLLTRHEAKDELSHVFGFECFEDFRINFIQKKKNITDPDKLLSIEEQDFVARALGFLDWSYLQGNEGRAPKVGITSLKRAYGRAAHKKPLSTRTLDIIADFICKKSWHEMLENLEEEKWNLENECLIMYSAPIFRVKRPKENVVVDKISSSSLKFGDKVKLTFRNGKVLVVMFEGDYTYKVLSTKSSILKLGYSFVVLKMERNGIIDTDEIYDENGNRCNHGYKSDTIKEIFFERNPKN